jgi:hypothetical protein
MTATSGSARPKNPRTTRQCPWTRCNLIAASSSTRCGYAHHCPRTLAICLSAGNGRDTAMSSESGAGAHTRGEGRPSLAPPKCTFCHLSRVAGGSVRAWWSLASSTARRDDAERRYTWPLCGNRLSNDGLARARCACENNQSHRLLPLIMLRTDFAAWQSQISWRDNPNCGHATLFVDRACTRSSW